MLHITSHLSCRPCNCATSPPNPPPLICLVPPDLHESVQSQRAPWWHLGGTLPAFCHFILLPWLCSLSPSWRERVLPLPPFQSASPFTGFLFFPRWLRIGLSSSPKRACRNCDLHDINRETNLGTIVGGAIRSTPLPAPHPSDQGTFSFQLLS